MSKENLKTVNEVVDWLLHEEPINFIQIKIDNWTVNIWFADSENNQDGIKHMLNEARHKGKPLTGTYSFNQHKSHGGSGQDHLHLYNRMNQIFAINKDGTAHDQSHDVRIPNAVADALRVKFPDWIIPANNLIEGVSIDWPGVWALNGLLNG